jgi:hypothetical protein
MNVKAQKYLPDELVKLLQDHCSKLEQAYHIAWERMVAETPDSGTFDKKLELFLVAQNQLRMTALKLMDLERK